MTKLKLEFRILFVWIGFLFENFMVNFGLLKMANAYSSTNLQAVRAFITDEVNGFELRHQGYGGIEAAMFRRDFTIPNLDAIRKAEKQTATAMYMKSKDFTIGTDQTCSPTGETSGSGTVDLSWVTKTVEIAVPTKRYFNNEVSKQKAIANDFYNAEKSILDALETYIIAYYEANRTGVNAISTNNNPLNTWVGGGVDTVQVANADINRFYNYARAEMRMNNYKSTIMEIHDEAWTAEQNYYQAQGSGNAVDTAFQFNGFNSYASGAVNPAGYYSHMHYLIPVGGVALIDWVSTLNREGANVGTSFWSTYSSLILPGLDMQLFRKDSCADTTADGGSTQDKVEIYELSLNFSVAKAPITVANETPIFKYGVLNA